MKILELPNGPQRPSPQDISMARETAPLFQRKSRQRQGPLIIRINDQEVSLPASLHRVLGACLEIIAEGQAVVVMPHEQEIGTQEAADLLGVSRPYLVKLLDSGAIASRMVGVQRRLRAADVLAYRAHEKALRRKVLTRLAAEGQRLNLGE